MDESAAMSKKKKQQWWSYSLALLVVAVVYAIGDAMIPWTNNSILVTWIPVFPAVALGGIVLLGCGFFFTREKNR